jgi:esterase/lipase superfamily enzyme
VTVITATDRQRDPAGIGYTARRSPRLQFERFTLAMPPGRKELGKAQPQMPASFAQTYPIAKRETLTSKDINIADDALIYVHGYNYSFQESLFQLAEVVADGELREVPLLFSWPSEGSLTGYVADKDAATYARDDLVELLGHLKSRRSNENITLFGHSMGAWLVVEVLRQLKLSRHDDALRRINQVVLAAPDIDIDLFKRQIETIGPLARPIIVLNSTDDRALAISRRIGGFRVRMGSIGEDNAAVQEMIAKKAIRVIDLSMLPAPDRANHNRFIKLAEILSRSERRRKTLLENGLDDALVHDSKKWQPVFRQDHAQIIR